MELKDYTTEELRAEIKRRAEMRCRNCKHCERNITYRSFRYCSVRTWGKKITHNYRVTPSTKACELFERKEL